MVLRFPLRRPHSWARRSLFWEENWKVPFDDCTHHMQLRIAGVWSISKRNWNSRSFLFPTKKKGDVNKTMTYNFLLLYWAWGGKKKSRSLEKQLLTLNLVFLFVPESGTRGSGSRSFLLPLSEEGDGESWNWELLDWESESMYAGASYVYAMWSWGDWKRYLKILMMNWKKKLNVTMQFIYFYIILFLSSLICNGRTPMAAGLCTGHITRFLCVTLSPKN